jgi:acetolactate synthase-1/2/3 large subunit
VTDSRPAPSPTDSSDATREGHGGDLAVAVARQHGVDTIFTLSGAHVFPMYDAAVKADPPMRLVDVRHEPSAVFAAEATGKLTRTPGLAVLTAGPGVTNGVSAITQAHFTGSPLVVVGGRAPTQRWGSGSLQELDQPPIVETVTKLAETVHEVGAIADRMDAALTAARSPHRGPAFLDVPMDQLYSRAEVKLPPPPSIQPIEPDPDDVAAVARLLRESERPVLVVGTDVWTDAAEGAAVRFVEELRIPVITNGMGRGVVPAGHPLLMTKSRSVAFGQADLVVVAGTPLDFRLGYGSFGGKEGTAEARVVHLGDAADQIARHTELAASAAGSLSLTLDAIRSAYEQGPSRGDWTSWTSRLQDTAAAAGARDAELLAADSDPIHPARIYGELLPLLADDAVLIGDGGDFVSFAGKFVEPARPGGWLDPGPYGCLGAGLGAAIAARIARPSAQVVLLLGDGAAGMSLMDIDTLARHRLPVVMIVGNNSCWGLEKHPMRFLYGYDVIADLAPETPYDDVAKALGGDGETVRQPGEIVAALKRAFDSEVPYLVNVITDPEIPYPRTTTGV